MKRNVARGNFLLIKIITGIFVALLAIYIPLKIYIAKSEKDWPENAEARLEIYVTGRFGLGSEPGSRLAELGELKDLIAKNRDEKPMLLVEACGSGCCGNEIHQGFLFDEPAWKRITEIGYDTIVPGAACPGRKKEDYFRRLIDYSGPNILLAPANLFPGSQVTGSLKKEAVVELTLTDITGGESIDMKAGIFCVLFTDSIYRGYDRNKPFNLIDPRMAALETAASMKKKNIGLVMALCSADEGSGEALAAEVPGVDLVVNYTETAGPTARRVTGGSLLVNLDNESVLSRITVTITADSLSAVVNEIERGG